MNTLVQADGQLTQANISVARTLDEVEALRGFWQEHAWHPRMDLNIFLWDQRHRAPVSRPYVLTFTENAGLSGILTGRMEQSEFEVKLGYWSLWKTKLDAIIIPNAGVLGDFSLTNARAAYSHLLTALRRHEAEVVLLDWLPVDSDLFKVVRSSASFWWRNAFVRSNPHWRIRLPEKAEELWNRSHHRRAWVRRIFKKVEADNPGKVKFRFFTDPAEVEIMCRDAEQVAAKSYQRGLGVGFVDDQECRERLLQYAKLGILRACILYVEGLPKAYWIGSLYKGRFFSAYLAHDPGFDKHEPGSLVFIKVLESLCAEGAHQIDLGPGDAFYKQRFADSCGAEACLYVLSPSARNLLLNAGLSAGEALAIGAKKMLASMNVLQSLKTKWRRRLMKS